MERFKFFFVVAGLVGVITSPLFGQTGMSTGSIGIKLQGAYNYIKGGDINEGLNGLNEFWKDFSAIEGYSGQGNYKNLNFGMEIGAEFIVQLSPYLGLGLGAGYLRSTNESEIPLTSGSNTIKLLTTPKVTVVPLEASVILTAPLGPTLNFSFSGGVGYYLTKVFSTFRFEAGSSFIQWKQEAEGGKIGIQGGLGLEIRLTQNFSFLIEAQGRYAKIGGFQGNGETSVSGGGSIKEEGTLWFWKEVSAPSGKEYALIFINHEKPTGAEIRSVREAQIDLTGGSLIAGIMIRL